MNKLYFPAIAILVSQISLALAGVSVSTSLTELQTLAAKGDDAAQVELGYRYHQGEGVTQDYAKAHEWYERAARSGNRNAQYNLAVLYAFGEGVTQDYVKAHEWYERAAEQNHLQAQYSMGIAYIYGEGVIQNPKYAAEWFQKAAEQGYERAQVFLASLYHTGDGVTKNYQQAAYWYRQAADQGNAIAQYNLGSLYRSGNGVPKDTDEAIKWLRRSATQGYLTAQNELQALEKREAASQQPVAARPSVETQSPADTPPPTDLQPDTAPLSDEVTDRKPGFFARLFGGTTTSPDDSGVVYATPDKISDTKTKPSKAVPIATYDTPDDSGIVYAASEPTSEDDKPGFFARLFGGTTTSPDDSGVVYATPDKISDTKTEAPKATPTATYDTPDDSGIVYAASDEQIGDLEGKPKDDKPGFFARLFGGTTTSPDDSGVVYATSKEISDANERTAKLHSTPEDEVLLENLAGIAELEDAQQPGFFAKFLDEQAVADDSGVVYATPEKISDTKTKPSKAVPIATYDTPDDSGVVYATSEPTSEDDKPGFFARLFGGTTTSPDDSGVVYATSEEISDAKTQESKAAPTVTYDTPDDSGIVYAASDEQIGDLEGKPKDDKPGFFARLFGGTTTSPDDSGVVYATSEEISDANEEASAEQAAIATSAPPADTEVTPTEKTAADSEVKIYTARDERATRTSLETPTPLAEANDIESLKPHALSGSAEAQYRLGDLYHHGRGVKRDKAQAFLWYRRAAEQNYAVAQYALANLYLSGDGVQQSDYLAREWFEKAAAQNHAPAEQALRDLPHIATAKTPPKPADDPIENKQVAVKEPADKTKDSKENGGFFSRLFGSNDPEDDDSATPLSSSESGEDEKTGENMLDRSGNKDTPAAPVPTPPPATAAEHYQQGLAHELGEGVEQNNVKAFALFRQAAEQHYAPAQYKLALAYFFAKGTEKNTDAAIEWYQKSAAQGYAAAQRTLATLYLNGDGVPLNKVRALAWYEILADDGRKIDIYRRDALKATLSEAEVEQANTLKLTLLAP